VRFALSAKPPALLPKTRVVFELGKPHAGEFIAAANLQAIDLVRSISGAHRVRSYLTASKAAFHQTSVRSMTSLANSYSAPIGAKFAVGARFAAESVRKLCKLVLAAMQQSTRARSRARHRALPASGG
jgi:hypothetical protein